MKAKNNLNLDPETSITLPEGVSWEELIKHLQDEKNQLFFKKIDPVTFKFLLEDSNRPKVIQALLEVLKKTDPQNATQEYAESLIEVMKAVAHITLKQAKV